MSSLLIQEVPLMVLPTLAMKIGLNEAMFLQQLHYWVERSQHEFDGYKWVYNTVQDWCKQFPFWSERTLARILAKLEREKLVLVGNYNRKGFDRTKWYTVNYAKLEELEAEENDPKESASIDSSPKSSNDMDFEESAGGSTILPNCQDEENRDFTASIPKIDLDGSIILPNCQDEEIQGLEERPPVAADIGGSMTLPDCHAPSCQYGRMEDANLSRPIPENNNREYLQRTTTTLRTRQSSMIKPSESSKVEQLLLSAPDYGLSETTVRKYLHEFGEELVLKEFDLLKKLIEQKKPIQNPEGWFRCALERQYEDTRANYEKIQQKKKAEAEARCQAMKDFYEQQDREERENHPHEIDPSSPFYNFLHRHGHGKGGDAVEA